jgi:hypothetical protein
MESAELRLTPLTRASCAGQFTERAVPSLAVRDADTLSLVPGVEFQPRALIAGQRGGRDPPVQAEERAVCPTSPACVVNATPPYALRGPRASGSRPIRDLPTRIPKRSRITPSPGYGSHQSVTWADGSRLNAGGRLAEAPLSRQLSLFVPIEAAADAVEPLGRHRRPSTSIVRIWTAGLGYRMWRTQRLGVRATYRERDASSEPTGLFRAAPDA